MISSAGTYRKYNESTIEMPRFNLKYLIKDYGHYRTISKVIFDNGKVDTTAKVDEYIFWESPIKPQ